MPWLVKVPAAVIETLPAAAMSPALVRSPEPASDRLPPLRICPALPSVWVTVVCTGAETFDPSTAVPSANSAAVGAGVPQSSRLQNDMGWPNISVRETPSAPLCAIALI